MRLLFAFFLFTFFILPFVLISQETDVSQNSDSVYLFVDKQPEFPGGMSGLNQFLGLSLDYPEEAINDSIQGKVYVGFIVEADGKITNLKILRGIGGGCDEEALRVIGMMPLWNPGSFEGKAVRVSKTLPIKFSLTLPQISKTKIYIEADTLPSFIGGTLELKKYINEKVAKYDRPDSLDADLIANIVFVVETDGSISNINVKDSIGYGLDEQAIEIVRGMPKWKPGKIGNTKVRVMVMLPIDFTVYTIVETMPEYPGGMGELMKFLATNITYPLSAKGKGIQGRVFVNFFVEADGTISNARVLRGIGGGCDEEALRVVNLMPKWKPGIQKGKPIRVSYNLPVKFTLSRE